MTWLYEGIQVNFRGEILEVRYDGEEDSEELKKVVESVVNAYIQEVRETQRIEKREVVDKLANLSRELKVDLEAKIEDYGKLAKDLDGGDSPIAREMLNMLVGELRLIDTQIFKAKEELIDLEVGRKVSEQEINSPAAIDRAVQEQLEEDPMLRNLQEEQYLIAQNIRSQSNAGRGNSAALKQLQGRYQGLAQEIQRYRYQTGEELKESIRSLPNDQYRIMMTNYIATRTEVERSLAELEAQKNEKNHPS